LGFPLLLLCRVTSSSIRRCFVLLTFCLTHFLGGTLSLVCFLPFHPLHFVARTFSPPRDSVLSTARRPSLFQHTQDYSFFPSPTSVSSVGQHYFYSLSFPQFTPPPPKTPPFQRDPLRYDLATDTAGYLLGGIAARGVSLKEFIVPPLVVQPSGPQSPPPVTLTSALSRGFAPFA